MQTNNLSGIGSVSYVMNPATVSETAVQTGGISAESMSGFGINMIPKEILVALSTRPWFSAALQRETRWQD